MECVKAREIRYGWWHGFEGGVAGGVGLKEVWPMMWCGFKRGVAGGGVGLRENGWGRHGFEGRGLVARFFREEGWGKCRFWGKPSKPLGLGNPQAIGQPEILFSFFFF
jgi:hypothetical protein